MRAEESKAETKNIAPLPPSPTKKARKSPNRAGTTSMAPAVAVNPTAWWNTLQDQFNRIAATAAGQAAPAAAPAKPARKKAKRRAVKTRA